MLLRACQPLLPFPTLSIAPSILPRQIDLFGQMVEDHAALTEAPSVPVAGPVASTVLPIAARYSQYRLDISADDVAHAESELFDFEAMLEDALALELETMKRKGPIFLMNISQPHSHGQ